MYAVCYLAHIHWAAPTTTLCRSHHKKTHYTVNEMPEQNERLRFNPMNLKQIKIKERAGKSTAHIFGGHSNTQEGRRSDDKVVRNKTKAQGQTTAIRMLE